MGTLSARLWKMGRAVVKLRAVPSPTWVTERGTTGGRGNLGALRGCDTEYRTGSDNRCLMVAFRCDWYTALYSEWPAPEDWVVSVLGVVRWPTKAWRRDPVCLRTLCAGEWVDWTGARGMNEERWTERDMLGACEKRWDVCRPMADDQCPSDAHGIVKTSELQTRRA